MMIDIPGTPQLQHQGGDDAALQEFYHMGHHLYFLR